MKRFTEILRHMVIGVSKAVLRFPLTIICLAAAASLICYMISLHASPPLVIEKMMFTLVVGSILGMASQFAVERFARLSASRRIVYAVSALLTAGYFLIILPAPQISQEITVRTFVAVFALVCTVLWLPAYKGRYDFNRAALIHFKSFFTSALYSGVLSAGLAAIITAIDVLLFSVNNDTYSYMMVIVWVLFAPIYYLSLLPVFNASAESETERLLTMENYPKFLEILVSYIAIPLVAAYTLVLFAYFVKILVSFHWPSGQLGLMVLIYSAAGLLIFVLASLLDNRFSVLYRRVFPKVLIPIVIMQMVSVWIRLNAYGVTESRYYVVLFGVFSIVIAILLSFKPVARNSYIALLAAGFAIFSIIPPMDAFTVSRNSQINRVEKILQSEGILAAGKITPKVNASEETITEVTNILSYLDRSGSLRYIAWLPQDFTLYQDMRKTFGFEPAYGSYPSEQRYLYANLDPQQPLTISGYDISVPIYSNRYDNRNMDPYRFTIRGEEYTLRFERISNEEARVSVRNIVGIELIGTGLNDFVKGLAETGAEPKNSLPPEKMTLELTQGNYKLKIVFQNVNLQLGADPGLDYTGTVFFGVKTI